MSARSSLIRGALPAGGLAAANRLARHPNRRRGTALRDEVACRRVGDFSSWIRSPGGRRRYPAWNGSSPATSTVMTRLRPRGRASPATCSRRSHRRPIRATHPVHVLVGDDERRRQPARRRRRHAPDRRRALSHFWRRQPARRGTSPAIHIACSPRRRTDSLRRRGDGPGRDRPHPARAHGRGVTDAGLAGDRERKGTALTAPSSAPSAGPPPWHAYEPTPTKVIAVGRERRRCHRVRLPIVPRRR